jgi:hypothetical protein
MQVRNSLWSKNAYVGEFGLTPVTGSGYGPGQDPMRKVTVFTKPAYDVLHVNMANTVLYPGAGDFRNAASGDFANPNIRTGLFLAPIGSMTAVQNQLNSSYNGLNKGTGIANHKQIPWVARFNNSGNNFLDTDGNPNNGYRFVPGQPLAANPGLNTSEQMLGRGDFSAQILHYRMRGAYSVNLFHENQGSPIKQGSVEGYTEAQSMQDVRDGWYNHSWNNRTNAIFNQPDSKTATMTLNPIVDGNGSAGGSSRSEQTGVIWSGQYSLSLPNGTSTNVVNPGKGALDILVSNLDTVAHAVNFDKVDAYEVFIHHLPNGTTYDDGSTMTNKIMV